MRPIFIGGCPRSGTTLLGSLLGAHSRVVCVPEMPFKINLARDLPWEEGPRPGPEIARFLEARPKARAWEVDWVAQPAYAADRRLTYREAIDAAVRAFAARQGIRDPLVWVDHTPYNIRLLREIRGAFAGAHFIHLVRDGRAVAASLLRCDFGPDTVLGLSLYWPAWIAFGLGAEGAFPDSVHRVRYEELVRSPAEVVTRICALAGLETTDEVLGREGDLAVPRHTRKEHRLLAQPPDPSRADAWKEELAARDIEVLEHEMGDVLEHLGYTRQAPLPTERPRWDYRLRDALRMAARPFRRLRHEMKFRLAYRRSRRPDPAASAQEGSP